MESKECGVVIHREQDRNYQSNQALVGPEGEPKWDALSPSPDSNTRHLRCLPPMCEQLWAWLAHVQWS